MTLSEEKYVAVTTFRKTGVPVVTATWIVPLDSGKLGFWTSSQAGKTKRLRNNPRVTVQPCDVRGRIKSGSTAHEGTAELITEGSEFAEVDSKVKAKYGIAVQLSKWGNAIGHIGKGKHPYGDIAVLITVDA